MAELPVGKTMPYNIEAEQAVLGSMIFDESALTTAMEALSADDFYTTAHKTIYTAIEALFTEGIPVDIVTLSDKLGGDIDNVGGIGYITNIVQNVLSTENLSHYIAIVEGKSILRRLVNAASEIIDISTKDEDEVSAILDRSEQLIFNILDKRGAKGFYHISEVVKSSMALLEELKKRGSSVTGVPTGFTALDSLTAGLQKSTLVIVAARPGVGKTSFALNIAENAAIRHKIPVAIFSLEMSKEELVNRVLSSEALVPSDKMRIGDLNATEMSKLAHSLPGIINAPVYIDDTPGISASEIRAKCRRMKLEKNIGLVVIDYLQLMEGKSRSDNRAQEIAEISRSLKIMSKELEIPVITLSQLNRMSESRRDKRPQISDLRESGAIEQDADIVMLLYNPDTAEESEEAQKSNIIECIVAKHRGGECRTINLAWRGEYTKFMNLDNRN
ncbi:MAG: replicative DNA helicase [Clostridia bacterium]|nr:replicative DNA helicase [Clostridia bacterium]